MSVLDSQNIAVSCCLMFFIIVNLNRSSSETNVCQKDFTGVNEECGKQINKNGSHSLEIRENCNEYFLHLNYESNTSIINLTVSIHYLEQDEDSIQTAINLKSTFKVMLCDLPTNTDICKGKEILRKEWQGNASTIPLMIAYLSHSSNVFIEISGTGNWSYYEITFSYNEIPYSLIYLKPHIENNVVSCAYKPNSVSLLQLPEPKTPLRGIEISFNHLTINTEMGEYILIGAGTGPFENKHSHPLYITQVPENSTFYVDDSSAFVAFVSGSFQRSSTNKEFEIQWEGVKEDTDNEAKVKVTDPNLSLICFYNYSAALEEYKKDKFEKYRQLFANISRKYLQGEYKRIQGKINNASVELLDDPMKTKENDALAILIRVTYRGKSIFTWSTLQDIIAESKENGTLILGFKVDVCPHQNYAITDKRKWDIVFYALVPVFGIFGLLMWAWKHNLFSQNCLTEKEEKVSFDHVDEEPNMYQIHAEPNMYGTTTIPKMRYEEGRGETTIQRSSLQEDAEGVQNAIMVEMNTIPRTSQEPDTLTRYFSGARKKSRPSLPFLQTLLDSVEEVKKEPPSGKTEGNESDHLYDSVSSSKQLDETKL